MMNYYGYGWNMMGPAHGVSWLLGAIFWVLIGFLFILLIVKLVAHSSDRHWEEEEPETGSETALGILKKRYAKGEISFREFEKMKKDIS